MRTTISSILTASRIREHASWFTIHKLFIWCSVSLFGYNQSEVSISVKKDVEKDVKKDVFSVW